MVTAFHNAQYFNFLIVSHTKPLWRLYISKIESHPENRELKLGTTAAAAVLINPSNLEITLEWRDLVIKSWY